jgi:hypothetical protein
LGTNRAGAYWITSSARPSSDCGIVWPKALAVLRLMANSNVVGCSMGRSPGLAPHPRAASAPLVNTAVDQLSAQGRRLYQHDSAAVARLLADAGYPAGVKVPFETAAFGSDWMDGVQI